MGSITTGVGLISGLQTAQLIDSLIAVESRPRSLLQSQVATLQARQAAMLDVNSRLLSLMGSASAFREQLVFRSALATSSDETILSATASKGAQPGTYQFIVKQLVATSQKLSRGFSDAGSTPIGLSSLTFELGRGGVGPDTDLETLNGGLGVDRGQITIDDNDLATDVTVDLGDATTVKEVLERINENGVIDVTATVEGDHIVVTHDGGNSITIADGVGDTTATDLGIAGTGALGTITGTDVNFVAGTTALSTLNDGNGVLVEPNVADVRITAKDGTIFDIDLARIDEPITAATLLSDLNNGSGIGFDGDTETADIKFTLSDGTTEHEVDLSGLTTVQGLIDRIATETGGDVALSVSATGDGFVVTDTTFGGSGTFKVEGAGGAGEQAAEDLGILGEATDGDLEGEVVPYLVDQPEVVTIQDVIDRINNARDTSDIDNDGRIVASIAADGVSLRIDDATGGGGDLIVASTASNPDAASALGIEGSTTGTALAGSRTIAGLNSVLVKNLNGGQGLSQTITTATRLDDLFFSRGLSTNGDSGSDDIFLQGRDGTTYGVEVDGLTDVQSLIDAFDSATGGAITLALSGQAFEATYNGGGGGPSNFQIQDLNGAGVASELGLVADLPPGGGNTVTGLDFSGSTLDVTDRAGTSDSIDLSAAESLSDVVALINASAAGVTASISSAGTGISITDTTGSTAQNLQLSGMGAAALSVTADVAGDEVQGGSLQHRSVTLATRLTDLNYGRGIGTGSFRITDAQGRTAEVSITAGQKTVYDLLQQINAQAGAGGPEILARINDTGDGILIEDVNADPDQNFLAPKVESLTGSAASDLGILGEADSIGGSIDGSHEREVEISAADTLETIAKKINDANVPVAASIINTGSGATPYRLSLTSEITGRDGEMFIDTGGFDLGLTTVATGADAKVFFGAENAEDAFLLTSSSNSVTGVIDGVTIDLHTTSDEAVAVTVSRDIDAIVGAVNQFVTDFNNVVAGIDQYDFFDTESESKGILLGNATTARIRSALFGTLQSAAGGVTGSFRFLSQVGIGVGGGGQLSFDENQFRDVYANDPSSVEALFADFESQTQQTSEEIVEGVTISSSETTVLSRGFGDLFKDLTDRFTDSINGVVTLARNAFDDQIESLNNRIEDLDERLAARRRQLEREFAAMELALAQLQEQSNALQSLVSNVSLAASAGIGR